MFDHGHPASYAQERLWFLEHWEDSPALYNIASAWWLHGPLDTARLDRALKALVARHEVLRTALVDDGGVPRLRMLEQSAIELQVVDLRARPAERARANALSSAQAAPQQRFDLSWPPLLRATLYRVGDADSLLALVIHHIVSDGWSMGVLWRDLRLLYADEEASLPALPLQYSDYVVWQRSMMQGECLDRQLGYWRKQLAGLSPLQLPADRPRPPVQSHRAAAQAIVLSAGLTLALKQLCVRENVTMYMLLLAAFQVLLGRYSAQDDVAVGSPIAGRTRREFEDLIGFFVNTLVLRGDLRGNPPFRNFLRRVRERALGAYAHQELPFEKLVAELNPPRDTSRSPLIQVMFVMQNVPAPSFALPGIEITEENIQKPTAKFDLTLTLFERDATLQGRIEYATDLFNAATIERMAGHFTLLLEDIVASPDTPIGHLRLLTERERQQLEEWNDAVVDECRDDCVPQLVEQHAARTPNAVALTYEFSSLTYGELNARANPLAHHLRALGVGPDVPVGVCLERSIDLVVALLAVLKAGGAYVPLDPSYPTGRLEFILADTCAKVVLTQISLRDKLIDGCAKTVCLDEDAGTWRGLPADNPASLAGPEHLAYIIYTSGSTGKPKGVMVSRANASRLFSATRSRFGFGPDDVWTCFHSYAFDFSVWEIWGALIHGSRLVVVPHRVSRNPDAFHTLLRDERVTVLNQTPSAFRQLIAADARVPDPRLALRLVILGGEALEFAMLRPWFDRYGDRTPKLVNMYGITETTVHVTHREVRASEASAATPSLIGRPIPGVRIHLVDRHLQPVPVGVAGEIVVGGTGVARGYVNRPDLTAERFIPDPFREASTATLYRSGDLARRLCDGEIEYLGRGDQQVKLRGFRIELGEIESTLMELPGVTDAAVLLREDLPGDPRLCAYIVMPDPSPDTELRATLKRKLPEYMIPTTFVHLRALHLTPNGKIDRRALPAPRSVTHDDGFRLPLTPMEQVVADTWAEVLQIPHVGMQDDFFDLGGHSLSAMRVVARLREILGIDLSIKTLFDAPTVAQLSNHLALTTAEPPHGFGRNSRAQS
ncbi:MAG TPA: amino acid adenylation domain-containing protein [Casimicrobiaceae bacterium]|nr:amino acid adenylation domain-containing protein [Casimicrobiaceae bacterium]